MVVYTGDLTIFIEGINLQEMTAIINRSLSRIMTWMLPHGLSISHEKCEGALFKKRKQPHLIHSVRIDNVGCLPPFP